MQQSKTTGDIELFADATGMQIYFAKTHMTLFCKAPDWIVYKYNPATKRYWMCPWSNFSNKLSIGRTMFGAANLPDLPVHKTGQTSHANYVATSYTTSPEHYIRVQQLYKHKEATGNYPVRVDMTTLDTTKSSKEQGHILSVVHLLPKTDQIPLTASGLGCDGKQYLFLTTSSVTTATPPANWLKLPADYTKVSSEAKLSEDEELNSNILDFMNTDVKRR